MVPDDEKKLYDECAAEEVEAVYTKREQSRDHLLETILRAASTISRCIADMLDLDADEISEEVRKESIRGEIERLKHKLKRISAQ